MNCPWCKSDRVHYNFARYVYTCLSCRAHWGDPPKTQLEAEMAKMLTELFESMDGDYIDDVWGRRLDPIADLIKRATGTRPVRKNPKNENPPRRPQRSRPVDG